MLYITDMDDFAFFDKNLKNNDGKNKNYLVVIVNKYDNIELIGVD